MIVVCGEWDLSAASTEAAILNRDIFQRQRRRWPHWSVKFFSAIEWSCLSRERSPPHLLKLTFQTVRSLHATYHSYHTRQWEISEPSTKVDLPDCKISPSGFSGLGVSALTFGTQVRGFKPGRSRRIFQGEKILSAPSFGRKVKPWIPCVPCRWFTACKRSLDVSWKSASRQN
jgi:hypothetical protein